MIFIFTCGLWLLVPKGKKKEEFNPTMAICQSCRYSWKA